MNHHAVHGTGCRLLLIMVCALVSLLSFQAKIAIPNASFQGSADPSVNMKLWINGDTSRIVVPAAMVVWFAFLLRYLLSLHSALRVAPASSAPLTVQTRLQFLDRFLRPPPFA